MRILNNNEGSLLITLIIAMTLIAVLGASFVSIIGSKNEGFTFIMNGQKANMTAKAGVEWAIRYATEGTDADGNSIFFSKPTLEFSKGLVSSTGVPQGVFSTSYDYSTDILSVDGSYNQTIERITLSNFSYYLTPITLIPLSDQKPSYRSGDRRYLDVRVVGNVGSSVTQIDLTTGLSNMHLRFIEGPGGIIFRYNDPNDTNDPYPTNSFPDCNSGKTNKPCNDWWLDFHGIKIGFFGVLLPSSVQLTVPNLQQSTIGPRTTYTYTFTFYQAAPPAPQHTVKFYTSPVASTIIFTP